MSAGCTPLQIQAEAQRRKRERAAQQAREQARAAQQALLRERSWRDWSAALWPDRQYAPRHEALWAWFEALRFGYKPPARIEDWPRGGGKSSSVEPVASAVYCNTPPLILNRTLTADPFNILNPPLL